MMTLALCSVKDGLQSASHHCAVPGKRCTRKQPNVIYANAVLAVHLLSALCTQFSNLTLSCKVFVPSVCQSVPNMCCDANEACCLFTVTPLFN